MALWSSWQKYAIVLLTIAVATQCWSKKVDIWGKRCMKAPDGKSCISHRWYHKYGIEIQMCTSGKKTGDCMLYENGLCTCYARPSDQPHEADDSDDLYLTE